jgi:hypothetical protein
MPDVERLQAEAEEAQIRSQTARSRAQAAKESLLNLGVRWAQANDRRSTPGPTEPLDRSKHPRADL